MKPNKAVRIKPRLKSRNGLQQQIAVRGPILEAATFQAHMEPDVIALGIDPVDIAGSDPQQFGAIGHPKFGQPGLRAARPLAAPGERPRDRSLKPLRGDGLQDIIDRIKIERLHCEAVMRGDEDHRRWIGAAHQCAGYSQPIKLGHGHVEQHQIRGQGFDLGQCAGAIAGGSGDAER